jgi:hypothetical protein
VGASAGRGKEGRSENDELLTSPRRREFLAGVFLISFAVLVFQIVQTRILSVVAWYYLAFFAISVAMLGMTAGAVWLYMRGGSQTEAELSTQLSNGALLSAVAMPLSVLIQFSLITQLVPTLSSIFSVVLLMASMTLPYLFAGITISLALTRSPFPASLVYGVDLLGAALGCAVVIGMLEVLDGPTAILAAGFFAALAAWAFARAAQGEEGARLAAQPMWRRPIVAVVVLAILIPLNNGSKYGFRPIMVKDRVEDGSVSRTERWNSYSRIVATGPYRQAPELWSPSRTMPPGRQVQQAYLNIDGAAGTPMHHFDGTNASIDFLKYDQVNLALHLPNIRKSAVIGVGGGRDLLSAHLFGVPDITGVELNGIFVDLHTNHPIYSEFSGLKKISGAKLIVDDARSWFAATEQSFDLIQMSMIDTWAATGAGAFTLSENGLYTLEGWRAFTRRLSDHGVFTVSRWYNPYDVSESGRMVALALATVMDAGAVDPRKHIFVAIGDRVATLVLSRNPLSPEQLAALREATRRLEFTILIDPEGPPPPGVIGGMLAASNLAELNRAGATAWLDLTVSTDNRPFFFNQLHFSKIPEALPRMWRREIGEGVMRGNLVASIALVLILLIASFGVIVTIVLPLRHAMRSAPRRLVVAGTAYFALIGTGFMFAEIALLQYFGIFLGHPIYALGVCLFSLILSTGLGSFASAAIRLNTPGRIVGWAVAVALYLLGAQAWLPAVFEAITSEALPVRIAVAIAVLMPAGFLMGFAFPTGITLVETSSRQPTPWFWGINGATGVLASVVAVMIGIAFGINVTLMAAAACYLLLIPAALSLRAQAVQP